MLLLRIAACLLASATCLNLRGDAPTKVTSIDFTCELPNALVSTAALVDDEALDKAALPTGEALAEKQKNLKEALADYKGASDTIVQGLAQEPRNKDLLSMKTRIDGLIRREKSALLQEKASALEASGDIAGAFKALEGARAVDAENATLQAKFEAVKAQYEAAEKARRSGLSAFERKKEAGDDKYKAGMFEEAIALYTQCIDSAPENSNPVALKALSNRSACYKQISNFDGTISDCTQVLEYEPDNIKALVRRAQAFEAVERYKLALQDVKYVLSMGINVAGMQNYKLCNQMQGRLAPIVEKMKSGNY